MKNLFLTAAILTLLSACLNEKESLDTQVDQTTQNLEWNQKNLTLYAEQLSSEGLGSLKFDLIKKIKKTPEMKSFFIQTRDENLNQVAKNFYGSIMADVMFVGNSTTESLDSNLNLNNVFCDNSQNPNVVELWSTQEKKTTVNVTTEQKGFKSIKACLEKNNEHVIEASSLELKSTDKNSNKCTYFAIKLSKEFQSFLEEKKNRNKADLFYECFL